MRFKESEADSNKEAMGRAEAVYKLIWHNKDCEEKVKWFLRYV